MRYIYFLLGILTGGILLLFYDTFYREPVTLMPPKNDTQSQFQWKLTTTWPPGFPIFHDNLLEFSENIKQMSQGRLDIKIYGGGILVPHLQAFDAVSKGTVEMAHSVPFYWVDKIPAVQIMASVPFGMTSRGMNAWLYKEGGLALWQDMYAPYNIIPFPAGNTGVQMGGWFNKKINTIEDFQGIRMRIAGLNADILRRVGVTPVMLSVKDLPGAFRHGMVNAAEWVGPFHDEKLGLYRYARYYYYPGWHEPGTNLELLINRSAWQSLPPDLQKIVQTANFALAESIQSSFERENIHALRRLREKHQIKILPFPPKVLAILKEQTHTVLTEKAAENPLFKKLYTAYKTFQKDNDQWHHISEEAYYHAVYP